MELLIRPAAFLLAQDDVPVNSLTPPSSLEILGQHIIAAVVFSALGIIVLALSFWIMDKLTPFSIAKEIEEDQNVALAIVVAGIVVGMSVIIAAAMLG